MSVRALPDWWAWPTQCSRGHPWGKAGALQHGTRRPGRRGIRAGSLIANPLIRVQGSSPVPLDAVLAGQTAVLTAREPDQALADFCDRYGLALLRIRPGFVPEDNAVPLREAAAEDARKARWTDVCLPPGDLASPLRALIADPGLSVLLRPDRVIAAVAAGGRLPAIPWPIRPQYPVAHLCPDPVISPAAEPWSPPCS
jgi:hypothetical protein